MFPVGLSLFSRHRTWCDGTGPVDGVRDQLASRSRPTVYPRRGHGWACKKKCGIGCLHACSVPYVRWERRIGGRGRGRRGPSSPCSAPTCYPLADSARRLPNHGYHCLGVAEQPLSAYASTPVTLVYARRSSNGGLLKGAKGDAVKRSSASAGKGSIRRTGYSSGSPRILRLIRCACAVTSFVSASFMKPRLVRLLCFCLPAVAVFFPLFIRVCDAMVKMMEGG